MKVLLRAWFGIEFVVVAALHRLLAFMPLRLSLWVGDRVAFLGYLLLRRRRRIAIRNIERAGICSSPAEVRTLAVQSFRMVVTMAIETIVGRRRIRCDNWHEHVRLSLPDSVQELMDDPKQGVLLAACHLGNWDIPARIGSMLKPIRAIYKPIRNPLLDRRMNRARSGEQLTMVPKKDPDFMRLAKSLAQGEALAIMMDQHQVMGVPVDFFGHKAKTTGSVAMLHLVARAPIVLVVGVRLGPLQYELQAREPLVHKRSGDRAKDVFDITQALTNEIETVVRRYPEQYMWAHRRWKTAERIERGSLPASMKRTMQ